MTRPMAGSRYRGGIDMRRGMGWRWASALALGLGLASLAKADEDDAKPAKTGNWVTRIFVKDTAKKKEPDAKKEPAAPSVAAIRQQAEADWLRRQEVCDRLRAIALEKGDKDLARKADALDQRAWDIYLERTGGAKGNASAEEPNGDHPSAGGAAPSPSAASANASAPSNSGARPAARKD